MAAGDDYRIKAADISAKARRELRPLARTELESWHWRICGLPIRPTAMPAMRRHMDRRPIHRPLHFSNSSNNSRKRTDRTATTLNKACRAQA